MPTTTQETTMTKVASLGTSRHGSREPQIEVYLTNGTNHRDLLAALHDIAAQVERATPSYEGWLVNMDRVSNRRGRVYLELLEATPGEAERGMNILKALAD